MLMNHKYFDVFIDQTPEIMSDLRLVMIKLLLFFKL